MLGENCALIGQEDDDGVQLNNINQLKQVHQDIDSFVIVSKTLEALNPGMRFDIYPNIKHAQPIKNIKLFHQLKKQEASAIGNWTIDNTYDFEFGGSQPHKIYIILNISTIDSSILTEFGMRGLFMEAVKNSIKNMPVDTKTFSINSKLSTLQDNSLYKIVSDDWIDFCHVLKIELANLLKKQKTSVVFYFYKCMHNLKSVIFKSPSPEENDSPSVYSDVIKIIELCSASCLKDNGQADNDNYLNNNDIILIQIHSGINMYAYPMQAALINHANLFNKSSYIINSHDNIVWYGVCPDQCLGTFANVLGHTLVPSLSYANCYMQNNHLLIKEHANCIFTALLNGSCDIISEESPKLANIGNFIKSLEQCSVLRLEAVLNLDKSLFSDLISFSQQVQDFLIKFRQLIINDLINNKVLTIIKGRLFQNYLERFKLPYEQMLEILPQLENKKPLDKSLLYKVLCYERLIDSLFWPLSKLSSTQAIENVNLTSQHLCIQCTGQGVQSNHLLHLFNKLLPNDNANWERWFMSFNMNNICTKIMTNEELIEMKKAIVIVKFYSYYSLKFGLGDDSINLNNELEKLLNEEKIINYIRENPEKQIRWCSNNIDYFHVTAAILEPKTLVGKLIKRIFLTKRECESKTLSYKLWLALNYHGIDAIPAIFINKLVVKEKIDRWDYWCRIKSVSSRSLLTYPTMGSTIATRNHNNTTEILTTTTTTANMDSMDSIRDDDDERAEIIELGTFHQMRWTSEDLNISDLDNETLSSLSSLHAADGSLPPSSPSLISNGSELPSSCSTLLTFSDLLTLSDFERSSEGAASNHTYDSYHNNDIVMMHHETNCSDQLSTPLSSTDELTLSDFSDENINLCHIGSNNSSSSSNLVGSKRKVQVEKKPSTRVVKKTKKNCIKIQRGKKINIKIDEMKSLDNVNQLEYGHALEGIVNDTKQKIDMSARRLYRDLIRLDDLNINALDLFDSSDEEK